MWYVCYLSTDWFMLYTDSPKAACVLYFTETGEKTENRVKTK